MGSEGSGIASTLKSPVRTSGCWVSETGQDVALGYEFELDECI